ncbi:MAG: GtrA family protein [Casimicrobium sp.]
MRETIGQVGRYLIGAFIALAIDASIVSVGVKLGAPVIVARLIALLAGVTTTYFFNRRYTFVVSVPASLANWSRYVAAQSIGTALNFAISTGLLYLSDRSLWQIWGSVLLGAGVGFCVNFFSARRQLHR